MVDGAAASVARGVIHHAVCSTHRVVQFSDTTTAYITTHCQVLLQRGAAYMRRRKEREMGGTEGGKKKCVGEKARGRTRKRIQWGEKGRR